MPSPPVLAPYSKLLPSSVKSSSPNTRANRISLSRSFQPAYGLCKLVALHLRQQLAVPLPVPKIKSVCSAYIGAVLRLKIRIVPLQQILLYVNSLPCSRFLPFQYFFRVFATAAIRYAVNRFCTESVCFSFILSSSSLCSTFSVEPQDRRPL